MYANHQKIILQSCRPLACDPGRHRRNQKEEEKCQFWVFCYLLLEPLSKFVHKIEKWFVMRSEELHSSVTQKSADLLCTQISVSLTAVQGVAKTLMFKYYSLIKSSQRPSTLCVLEPLKGMTSLSTSVTKKRRKSKMINWIFCRKNQHDDAVQR